MLMIYKAKAKSLLITLAVIGVGVIIFATHGFGLQHDFQELLQGVFTRKNLWFYSYFGLNLSRDKSVNPENCDYDDPNKIKDCPPTIPPYHVEPKDSKAALAATGIGLDEMLGAASEAALGKTKTGAPTGLTLGGSSVCDVVVAFDDFEGTSDGTWIDGDFTHDPELGNFLGRLGEKEEFVRKTFPVPVDSERLTVEFWLKEIEKWDICDNIFLTMAGQRIDLKQIIARKKSQVDFLWPEKVELVVLSEYYPNGLLEIGFETKDDTKTCESGGIDDLKITAHYCSDSMHDDNEPGGVLSPTAAPSWLAECDEDVGVVIHELEDADVVSSSRKEKHNKVRMTLCVQTPAPHGDDCENDVLVLLKILRMVTMVLGRKVCLRTMRF